VGSGDVVLQESGYSHQAEIGGAGDFHDNGGNHLLP
jgi:hypothetical protein